MTDGLRRLVKKLANYLLGRHPKRIKHTFGPKKRHR